MNQNEKFVETFVSIIILNYNGGKVVLECLESVYKTYKCKFEVILVDNCSTDNSHIKCKEKFPGLILIENKENIAMAARNIGLKKARGNFIVFLDSDTEVEPNWLNLFIESHNQHGEGLYGPKFLRKEQRNVIDSAGNMINIFGLGYARGKGEQDIGQYEKFQKISYTAGACIFSSSDTMQKIGEIDEVFFAYHDDVDYGWRAILLGIPSYYDPKIIVYHLSSPTLKWSQKKFFLLERNRWICLLTLYSRTTIAKIFPLLIIVEIGMFFYFLKNKMGFTKLKTLSSLIELNQYTNKRHEKFMKTRLVNDKQVIKNFVDDFWLPAYKIDQRTAKYVNKFIIPLAKMARTLINI